MSYFKETSYGFELKLSGPINSTDEKKFLAESKKILKNVQKDFKVLVDMRDVTFAQNGITSMYFHGPILFRKYGMARSCVILENSDMMDEYKQSSRNCGVYEFERYISAKNNKNWKKQAMDWLLNGIDPDL